jgi:hypothetical protein
MGDDQDDWGETDFDGEVWPDEPPPLSSAGIARQNALLLDQYRAFPGTASYLHRRQPGDAGAHGGEDVGPVVAPVARRRGAAAGEEPAVADPALVADAGLVLGPQLEPLVEVRRGGGAQGACKAPFLKAWRAAGSPLGCSGRAFCQDRPRRRSTRHSPPGC